MIAVLWAVGLGQEALRFMDGEMMEGHHKEWRMGMAAQNITVHMIPHSHDDVGWLKTVDQYYYGARNDIQLAGVQFTIDGVVQELAQHPEYRFSIVEMAFLQRWWNQATEQQRTTLRRLVKQGQIEIINGGWCMNDEANAYYQDIIDQMATGLRWANETLGAIPTVGWHIDPFGHHSAQAALFAQMGFNGWFFARIDYQDKQQRMADRRLQTIWRPAGFPGSQIFSQTQYYHYSAPPGFNFDIRNHDEPVMDDPDLQGYNLQKRGTQLVEYFQSMAMHFRTSNLIHTFGEDFTYYAARPWFKNLDKLIKYVNANPIFNTTLKYSTPSAYLRAIKAEDKAYPLKTDDFFPYSDCEHGYWSGYYVSRTALKGFVRGLGRWFNAARTFTAVTMLFNQSNYARTHRAEINAAVFQVAKALGVLQHHDAVSGTAKQAVTNDYHLIGSRAYLLLNKHYLQIKSEQANKEIGEAPAFFSCWWNASKSQCDIHSLLDANKTVLVQLYNPGGQGTQPVRLLVPAKRLQVLDANNTQLVGDVICEKPDDGSSCSLSLLINLGEQQNGYIKVRASSSGKAQVVKKQELGVLQKEKTWTLGGARSLYFQKKSQTFNLTFGAGKASSFHLSYEYYESYQGPGQKSGAYIFRPSNKTYYGPIEYAAVNRVAYFEGETVLAVSLQTDRLYSTLWFLKNLAVDSPENGAFEVTTFVDSIPITDLQGKQVVLKIYSQELMNNDSFFTDSSGMALISRKLNYQPQYNLTVHQPTAGNYYPVTALIQIVDQRDPSRKMTVLTDRSQGGASLKNGTIQIMIQRRLVMDDARGVDQPLYQNQTQTAGITQLLRHKVIFDDSFRTHQFLWDARPIISYSVTASQKFIRSTPDPQRIQVPPGVKLYLVPNSDGSFIVRMHNTNSVPVTVPLTLPGISSYTQTTLGANQKLTDWLPNKIKYRVEGEQIEVEDESGQVLRQRMLRTAPGIDVSVGADQIRTFIAQ